MKLNQIPVYDVKVGDRIHIFNTQLDRKLPNYDRWKLFSAIVTAVNHGKTGNDDYYQFEFENNKSGWYESGYMFNTPSSEFTATRLEDVDTSESM